MTQTLPNQLPLFELTPNLLQMNGNTVTEPAWGPNGQVVYERTYQRVKADGSKESWDDTVRRVVRGNLSLVPANRSFPGEEDELYDLIYNFRAIPAGRHLWMSGVEGRQFLFNCYVSGWGNNLSDHFAFTFNQLMEGGGVGANYSQKYLNKYKINTLVSVHIVCSPEHDNYQDLVDANLLSTEYDSAWDGAYEIEDSREGWTQGLVWVIDRSTDSYSAESVDLVLDVTNIRPAGKRIKTFGGTSAGPVPFAKMMKDISHLLGEGFMTDMNGPLAMEMDHAIATCVVSGNVRRSARMSQMHWLDPWIKWFLDCKRTGDHWSTNISVEIDNEFLEALNNTSHVNHNQAWNVYEAIAEGMLENGEPGFWNSSLANHGEPNPVTATNPCGEICLEEWENCNLGHVNLSAFVNDNGTLDYDGLHRAHYLITRFLIRASFGDISDPKTQVVVARNRRIGVGHFGYADMLAKLGIKYSDSWDYVLVIDMLQYMKETVDKTAVDYSHDLRIPVPVKTTTVAPTGTISKLPGVNGEGIHPIFAKYYIQRIRFSTVDPDQARQIEEYFVKGYNVIPDPKVPNTDIVEIPMKSTLLQELEDKHLDTSILQDASEISFTDFLKVQQMYQTFWADNAVSFTINLNPALYTPQKIMGELHPFLGTLKGTTVFPQRGYELSPYERVPESTYKALRATQSDFYGDGVDEVCKQGACPVR